MVRGSVGAEAIVSSTAAAFGFTGVGAVLPEGIAVTAGMVKSFGLAPLTADARLRRFGAWNLPKLNSFN